MNAQQKLNRIAEILRIGWRNITGSQRREIFTLVGITIEANKPERSRQIVDAETLAKAKAIRKAVAEAHGIAESFLWMPSRIKGYALTRHKAMVCISKRCPSMSEEAIGDLFNRDRGTVRHALRRINPIVLAPTEVYLNKLGL